MPDPDPDRELRSSNENFTFIGENRRNWKRGRFALFEDIGQVKIII